MRRTYTIGEGLGALCPGAQWALRNNDYEQLEWYSTDQAKPSLEDINQKILELEANEPMRVMREIRDWYLQQSDWTQGADIRSIRGAEWCAAWDEYRQKLRNITTDYPNPYFDERNYVQGVVWPDPPNLK